ncbi:MAG: phosphopantetheine-binding protein [Acetobacter okinawensis]|uniref:phosphopantetheine-binding protein n=1 Tax=Acetobacter okinawensis TaxID=1076594 RepID=UPI001BA4D9C1|nr:phosphopantetheine-binding protein [Acetobacter okinawensis]MBS0987203.1 acyl carrier protein [Acetobacter okinawensis]
MRHAVNTTRSTTSQTPFEHEVAERLVAALQLEVTAEEIVPEAPLFGEGLGLDSIDALEIALLVGRDYGVTLRSDAPDNRQIFSSLRALCQYVQAHRAAR